MSSWLPTIIQLASGALGGNLAGNLLKNLSMGPIVNSILGIAGGGLGGWLLSTFGLDMGTASEGSMGLSSILGSVAGGGVGGSSSGADDVVNDKDVVSFFLLLALLLTLRFVSGALPLLSSDDNKAVVPCRNQFG